ncbi:MAG: DNA-3-methyladenine glycosylase I [Desulfobacterales bacterium]|jgi:DNA-3-methyladenine glycosylase I
MKNRCPWAGNDPIYVKYHDNEWGVPLHDDRKLFEFLLLDGFQAGLSWITILKKRTNYRNAFDYFDARKIAVYDKDKIQRLLNNKGIIRNRLKIEAAVQNARSVLGILDEFDSFDDYIWQFTGGQTIRNAWQTIDQVPAWTNESNAMSKDLKQRGFKFVGPTICYAFMQAAGMVNDHLVDCFRYQQVQAVRMR